MSETITFNIDSAIEKFKSLVERGLKNIEDASKIYVQCLDEDPASAETFRSRCSMIPESAWSGFEAVGRGWYDYRLLLNGGPACRMLRRLPRSQQTSALDDGVEVLVQGGDILKVKVENLSPTQAKQVFAKDHIRSLGAQRAFIEEQVAPKSKEYKPTYTVRGNVLHVNAASKFTRQEITRILMEMG